MSKFKFPALVIGVLLASIVFSWLTVSSQALSPRVILTTEPSIDRILPFEAEASTILGSRQPTSPTILKLQALDAKQQPLANSRIRLQILTPPQNIWFTTDFPLVEGTKLLDIEADAPQGKLSIEQTLPIRGKYQLLVNVKPIIPGSFVPFEQNLSLKVSENALKYLYFVVSIAIFLIVGLVGGWVIGTEQKIQPGEIVPERVRLLLSGAIIVAIVTLLFINISAELAHSHFLPHSHATEVKNSSEDYSNSKEFQELKLQLSGDELAKVGEIANLQVEVIDAKTTQPVNDVILQVKTTQMEDNWLAFAYRGTPDATGKLKWQQQFFDGAPHQIEVEVSPQPNGERQFLPFQVRREIEVEAVEPPLIVRLIGLAYFTSPIVVGLLLGMKLRDRFSVIR